MRIMIPTTSETANLQLWNSIYGEVLQIGRLFRREVPGRPFQPSKYAAKTRGIAGRLKNLAAEVKEFSPILAECLDHASKCFADEAAIATSTAKEFDEMRGQKRHMRHPETEHILFVTRWIHRETGKYHDKEFAALLNLAGLNRIGPETLRTLRAKKRY